MEGNRLLSDLAVWRYQANNMCFSWAKLKFICLKNKNIGYACSMNDFWRQWQKSHGDHSLHAYWAWFKKAGVTFVHLNVRELSRGSEVKLTLHLALVRLLLEYYLVLVSTLQMDIDELEGIQRRTTWMLTGLGNVPCCEILKQLYLVIKEGLENDLIAV